MRAVVIDENRSVWTRESPPRVPLAPLVGAVRADVAVIGGGFTGVSTAWHLARRFPDRRIVLLEARSIGNGASGRNGGQALSWIAGIPSDEPELARRIYDFTRSGIDLIERLALQYAPAAGFTRNGSLEVCTDARRAEEAHAHVERLRGWGIPLRWVPGAEVGLAGARGAAHDPAAGQLNGHAFLGGLAGALVEAGVAVHEGTPVLAVNEGAEVRLATPSGEVRAAAVVLATNAYTPSLGYFRDRILPLHSHVVATDPLPAAVWEEMGWGSADGFSDDLDRIAYGCRTASGRLVFGGGSNRAYQYLYGGSPVFPASERRALRGFAAVEATERRYFPALAARPTTERWTGPLAVTFDRVCSMGVLGEARNVYYALGYSGHGVVLAMLAGRVLSDLYAGDHEAWRAFPFYQRRMPRIPPEPLRWTGYQIYTRLTGRSPRAR